MPLFRRLGRTLSRGVAPIALVAAGSLAATGCGGGSYYAPLSGTLEVKNSPTSFFTIDAVEISTPSGPVDHHNVFLSPGQSWTIDLRPDSYDIDFFWSDGSTESWTSFDINDGEFRVLTGYNP